MKIKKYFAADIRQALDMARRDHGPDVVILSNRKVLGGIELVAAKDYDENLFNNENSANESTHSNQLAIENKTKRVKTETTVDFDLTASNTTKQRTNRKTTNSDQTKVNNANKQQVWTNDKVLQQMQLEIQSIKELLRQQMSGLAWGTIGREHPLWANLLRQLSAFGLSSHISRELVENIPDSQDYSQAWNSVLSLLANRIPKNKSIHLTPGQGVMFVGAAGAGKTTTLAKFATKHAMKYGPDNLILASTDTFRVGAREQLRSYGRLLSVPVRTIHNADELKDLFSVSNNQKVKLIDTAGLSNSDGSHDEQIDLLRQVSEYCKTALVFSATDQIESMQRVLNSYRCLNPEVCIPCKTDEASSFGELISLLINENLPMAAICNGQKVPDDIENINGEKLVKRAEKIMQQNRPLFNETKIEQDFGNYEFQRMEVK